jgi:hypothetical protein
VHDSANSGTRCGWEVFRLVVEFAPLERQNARIVKFIIIINLADTDSTGYRSDSI